MLLLSYICGAPQASIHRRTAYSDSESLALTLSYLTLSFAYARAGRARLTFY